MFYAVPILFMLLLITADRLTKWLVDVNMTLGGSVTLIPGVLRLYYARNDGAAFGMLPGGRWVFVGLTVVAVAAAARFYVKWPRGGYFWERLCLAVIASGAVGNAVDRAFSGEVIDFLDFTFVNFAVFNVADICIVCGSAALALLTVFGPGFKAGGEEKKEKGES